MAIVVLTQWISPGGHILKKAVINGWDDLYFTGAVQKDWYREIEAGVLPLRMKPGASATGPLATAPAYNRLGAQPSRSLSEPTRVVTSRTITAHCGLNRTQGGLRPHAGHLTEPYILGPYDGGCSVRPGPGPR